MPLVLGLGASYPLFELTPYTVTPTLRLELPLYSASEEEFARLIPATGLENWPIMEVGTNPLFVRGLAGVVWPSLSLSLFLPQIVARLVDGSRFHPFKEKFGTTLCAGFARISGCVGGSHNCTFPPPHTHTHTLSSSHTYPSFSSPLPHTHHPPPTDTWWGYWPTMVNCQLQLPSKELTLSECAH